MKRLILSLAVILSTACPAFSATLIEVIDGDTIKVDDAGKVKKVRLANIDAPELKQAYGPEAKILLETILKGQDITLENQKMDFYRRTLADVSTEECEDVSLAMICNGLAWNYKRKTGLYAEAQLIAQEERIGLWIDPTPIPPWDFRKHNRFGGFRLWF